MVGPSAMNRYPMAKAQQQQRGAVSPPPAIARAIVHIEAHPAIAETKLLPSKRDSGVIDVQVSIRVNLPTEWLPAGRSPTGVGAVEHVVFRFGPSYPFASPEILLRQDFNRALPHIQPGSASDFVVPCYYDGVPDELLQQSGLIAVVNQVVVWLQKAAFDTLIDRTQGWEPTRRDNVRDTLIADADKLQRWVGTRERVHIFHADYMLMEHKTSSGRKIRIRLNARVREVPVRLTPELVQTAFTPGQREQIQWGHSFALLVCPGSASTSPIVISHYQPETISTWADLMARSGELGCADKLQAIFERLAKLTSNLLQRVEIPVFLMLAVRRPFALIGSNSSIELLPYVIWVTSPITGDRISSARVLPLAHRYTITQDLLRQMSGTQMKDEMPQVVQLGCGSLGSKIAIHLARAGLAPDVVVDKGDFSPHNAARHGLLPYVSPVTEAMDSWLYSKANLLAKAVGTLGKEARAHSLDIITLITDIADSKDLFSSASVAINSTASLAVRECLASPDLENVKARIIETALYGQGAVGLMTLEGVNRNPNCTDLTAEAYVLMREQKEVQATVFSEKPGVERHAVGQGCGSVTMIMSDARLSMLASAMAERIGGLLQSGLPADGEILIGHIGSDGMSMSWKHAGCSPFSVVVPANASKWSIRISPRVHEKITDEVALYPSVETGGMLIGRVSEAGRTITVVDILPAPTDSQRSAGLFVLGVKGVTALREKYESSTQGALYCVGTWHSHLYEGGASSRDYETAKIIGNSQLAPSVLVIKTPTSYHAILASEQP